MEDLDSYFEPGCIFRSDSTNNDCCEGNKQGDSNLKSNKADVHFTEHSKKRDDTDVDIDVYFPSDSIFRSSITSRKSNVGNKTDMMNVYKREVVSFSSDEKCKSILHGNKTEGDGKLSKVSASKNNLTRRSCNSEHKGNHYTPFENVLPEKGHVREEIVDTQYDDCNIDSYFKEGSIFRLSSDTSKPNLEKQSDTQIVVEKNLEDKKNDKQTTIPVSSRKSARIHKSSKKKLTKVPSFSADDVSNLDRSMDSKGHFQRSVHKFVSKLKSKSKCRDTGRRHLPVFYRAKSEGVIGSSLNFQNFSSEYFCKPTVCLEGDGDICKSKHTIGSNDTRYFSLEHTFTCTDVSKSIRSFSSAAQDNCWVSFVADNKIQCYDRHGSIKDEILVNGNVDDITADAAGDLYISLTKKRQILIYNSNKKIKTFIELYKQYPRGIANFESKTSIVVCCNFNSVGNNANLCSNDKVRMFLKTSARPKGECVTESDCFGYPVRVCVNRNDDVIVTDFDKRRMVSISPRQRVKFSFSGCTEFSFDEGLPSITCDSMSNIFIVNKRGKVCLLDPNGNLMDIFELPMQGNSIKTCLLDQNNYLWTGGDGGKIAIFRYHCR